MEQNKERKDTGNDLWKYEKLQQKSLTLLKIIAYITNIVVQSRSVSESDIAKFVGG